MNSRVLSFLLVFCLFVCWVRPALADSGTIQKGAFRFEFNDTGIAGIANPSDPHSAEVTDPKQPLQLVLRYRSSATGGWIEAKTDQQKVTASVKEGTVILANTAGPIRTRQTFTTNGIVLDWTIELESASATPVTIGDVAIGIPVVSPYGSEDPKQIFERGFMTHQFISGNGSFLYFVRASGAPPFLVVTVMPGTSLEYFARQKRALMQYIHSEATGAAETRGTWRQPHTSLKLGTKGESRRARYGFRMQWANSYNEIRNILYREGLFDVRSVPGMTVPEDLKVELALHTKAKVESLSAEFPAQTNITEIGEPGNEYRKYEIKFSKLGENKLTITSDGGRKSYLEYFVTEPLETLIKKRSAFLVNRQQVRDSSKWWDGVYAPYDMRGKVIRTPEDPDIFTGRMAYVLTCDDPGLSKAPYLAEKNVSFPDQREIDSIEYYLQHFVWGKLQRTDAEIPYPYGIYGTPDWYTNRDPERRAKVSKTNLDKMHVWRSYDYPHVVMLYFHMYEIAKKYPQMTKYLDASGYLERAYRTAEAFYRYPYEIMPDYYETYKWGLYDELIVLKLADALEQEGYPDQAKFLRAEWEKKVKYFVYDDQYPFRSEYAFDRTAFESTYAFAKYGATHDMQPDQHLWWDIKLKKWYSHPAVAREDSMDFMQRQLAAGLTVRGWLEPAYNQLGSDNSVLSYMAAMGGWGILDYAINFSSEPYDWLQLGYASYLSSWALMNTGRADTNYGYWFPGKENDGAAGWQYMPEKYGRAWMGDDEPRGAWRYDGEIDLGFIGALRMAATVVTRDPTFDWIAYGGELTKTGEELTVIPRDGLRQRFAAVLPDQDNPFGSVRRFKMQLDRDGFADGHAIETDKQLRKIVFKLENRTHDQHSTSVLLSFPIGSEYDVFQNGKKLALTPTGDWDYPWKTEVNIGGNTAEILISRRP